jgi:hypothetical protein
VRPLFLILTILSVARCRMIPESTRETVLSAMDRFDSELRETATWSGWEQNQVHKYAIEWEGRRYPVKEIVSLATGAPVSSFSGCKEPNVFPTKLSSHRFAGILNKRSYTPKIAPPKRRQGHQRGKISHG